MGEREVCGEVGLQWLEGGGVARVSVCEGGEKEGLGEDVLQVGD